MTVTVVRHRAVHGVTACMLAVFLSGLFVPQGIAQSLGSPPYTIFTAGRSTSAGEAQTPRVSISVHAAPIADVLNQIAAKAGMALGWSREKTPLQGTVSVSLHDVTVWEALAAVLKGSGVEVKLSADGQTILLAPAERGRRGRTVSGGVIVGQVTDSATGAGLRGAQVRLEGLPKFSTVTSDSGRFTLRDVPLGDQMLLVRLFGYRPVTRTVTVADSERTTIRIAMVPVPTVLSGVVTTATGVQRKVEVGNDITTLNVDSIMRVAPISTVTDLLETRVPGLTVLHSSGVPGDPSRIRIRGASSITGNNDPIVIVDGVRVYASQSERRNDNLAPSHETSLGGQFPPSLGTGSANYAAPSPLDQIDPSSIETIEVFKGPSASALYGSDAANGVIVVTTKHGRAGPTHWTLNLGQGVNWLPGQWPVNYFRFGHDVVGLNPSCLGGLTPWNSTPCVTDSIVPFQALNDSRYSLFSHGSDRTASLTVSGGVPTLQYSLTGNATGTLGDLKLPPIEVQRYEQFYGSSVPGWMLRPDNYQTWGVNGNLTLQPMPAMRVTLTSSLFDSHQQQGSLQGAISELESQYVSPTLLQQTNAVLITNEVERATDQQLTSTHALTLTWQPYPWLPLNATGGINTIQRDDQTYIPYGINSSGLSSTGFVVPPDTVGAFGLGHGTSQDQTFTVGTAIPTLRNRVMLGIGANYHSGSTADVIATASRLGPGISSPTDFCVAGAQLGCQFTQQSTAGSTYGWYVEPRLNISSRFFAAPGFRLDGGSASGTHGGFAGGGLTAFPKIDFSYLAVDQSHPRGALTLLRPRLAFGYAGTQPDPAAKLRLLSDTVGTVGGSIGSLIGVQSLGNTALRPETSHELEGGLDAELWRGRLSMTWSQYNKTRNNAILSIPVAPSVNGGGITQNVNIGVVRNTGTEMTVQAQVFESHAFGWTVGGNLSKENNIVVRLNPGQAPIVLNNLLGGNTVQERIVAGYPLFSRWALPIVSFADLNHNGFIEPNEIVYGDSLVFLGGETPNYQMNLNTGVTLLNGRLSVNTTFAYQNGLTQINAPGGAGGGGGPLVLLPNAPGTSLATQAAVVAATGGNGVAGRSAIGLVQTVNTFRFNALSINYEVPQTVATWFRVPRATLALQGSNLGLHTNYRGKDPGVNAFSTVSTGDITIDTGQLPQPRVWWLKLTVGN